MIQYNDINERVTIRRVIIVLCVLFVIIAGFTFSVVKATHKNIESFKPYSSYTRLMHIASGCDKFKEHNGSWPKSLEELQINHPEFDDPWDKDTWGRQITLVPYQESIGYGEVISYGRDGKPGGVGFDTDLIVKFPTDANADWNIKQGEYLRRPGQKPSSKK